MAELLSASDRPEPAADVKAPRTASPGPRPATTRPSDPWLWCLALSAIFAGLASIRLTVPSAPYFDEVHYLPAARDLLSVFTGGEGAYINQEHPLLGKTLMALGMLLAGDNPLGWRIASLLAGTLAVGAAMRALWHASYDRFATIAFGILIITGFHLFIHARIAMLDIFVAAFLSLAAWQFAAACREPETGRWRLALTGVAIGLSLGTKWSAVPLAASFGLMFFGARLAGGRRRLLVSRRGIPVPGISLLDALFLLGLLPLIVYLLTFAPGFWLSEPMRPSPLLERGLIGMHENIIALQAQVLAPHGYQSTWPQWVMNTRGIWYLYEHVDGAQRGVLLIGNPLTMLLGLPALVYCLVTGFNRAGYAKLAAVGGYALTLGLWLIVPKPVQFYYHYVLPSIFLLAALALALADMRKAGAPRTAYGVLAGSVLVFALFFKILTAAPLDGPMSFLDWTWIEGWR